MTPSSPEQGDVWFVLYDSAPPARGHEQAYPCPALVVSVDKFNSGPAGLVVMLPISNTNRRNPFHVPLAPPEGGIAKQCFILCDQIGTVSHQRLRRHMGSVTPATFQAVMERLRTLLGT